jgi:hypothetical protein
MDSIDKLLAQIKAESQEPIAQPNLSNLGTPIGETAIDRLLQQVKGDDRQPPTEPKSQDVQRSPSLKSDSAIDSVLTQLQAEYQQQDKVAAQQQQQQLQAEQFQQQQQRQKQLDTLKVQAQAWLEQLEPLSTEGLWFERFAEAYTTKLEAAISYLQEA